MSSHYVELSSSYKNRNTSSLHPVPLFFLLACGRRNNANWDLFRHGDIFPLATEHTNTHKRIHTCITHTIPIFQYLFSCTHPSVFFSLFTPLYKNEKFKISPCWNCPLFPYNCYLHVQNVVAAALNITTSIVPTTEEIFYTRLTTFISG